MLPSNNNINGNTNSYDNPTLLYHKPFINDQLFSNFYNFPSSPPPYNFFDTSLINEEEEELFLQQYLDLPLMNPTIEEKEIDTTNDHVIINNMVDYSNKNDNNNTSITSTTIMISPQKKRGPKKDRHSKITTAKGPRDRRMRLSLEIAREFFGLQDMLGYDKASKTVEWLLTKAKIDINKLGAKSKNDHDGGLTDQLVVDSSTSVVYAKSSSSISECEVISGIKINPSSSKCVVRKKEKLRANKEVRRPVFLARETREKARARARERTKNKILCAKLKPPLIFDATTLNNNQDSIQVGSSWSPPMSLEVVVDDDHSSIFNYHLGDHTEISHDHQFEDFHFDRKIWESYYFQSLL